MEDSLDKIVDCIDCIPFCQESKYIDVFKKIFLAEPLDEDMSNVLHDNLWNLYEESITTY